MRYDSKRTVILSGKQYVQTNEKKEKGNQHRDSKTIIASWAAQQSDQYRVYRSGGGCDIFSYETKLRRYTMRMMVMIIYLLFLICMIVYYGKMMYRNYQKELPLGYGQNKIVYFMILLCIIIGQYTIPSAWGRLSVILIFGVAFFLIYAMIGLHNRKNHSGELFRLYQKEVTTAKRCIIIGTGVVVVALFLVCFIKK